MNEIFNFKLTAITDLPFQGVYIMASIVPGRCPGLNSARLSARHTSCLRRANPVDYRDAYSLKG